MMQRNTHIRPRCFIAACFFVLIAVKCADETLAAEPFRIRVVDDENDWPVPLVEFRTTHDVRFVSDNAGVIAVDLPEVMNVETWFHVEGHGYSVKADAFGYRGVRITPRPGESTTVKVHRELPARRLGRITGGGLFAESQKLGEQAGWTEQGIFGCDSVQNASHNGRTFWIWGDTTLPSYPLGRFHSIGATSHLQPLNSFEPPVALRYSYFTDAKQVPRNLAKLPGDGPKWLSGLVSLPDSNGTQRLGATYSKIKPPLEEYERGLCVWNDEAAEFQKHLVIWEKSDAAPKPPSSPVGHAVFRADENGEKSVLFGDPFPTLQCNATFDGWSDPKSWKALVPQESVQAVDSGVSVKPHRGGVAWNEFRKKWVTVFTQMYGKSSALGEIWYAEADSPTGPWQNAIHVVTHNKYTFYNPSLHPEFTPADSPILLFEATYTKTFSSTTAPTPRHNYNQVLYRLDLNELTDRLPSP